ncbi:MAG TPA: L-rhamnose mutarotase [Pilimelia sp.]|nr:L-rhamnose mutarotase [Pilimelia sp.]
MARAAFILTIKPDRVDEYVTAHAEVWPEMRAAISASGIRNYSIFLHGNQAFGYLESDDFDASYAYLAAQDVNQRWQDAMADLLEGRVADEGPTALPEIFRLD